MQGLGGIGPLIWQRFAASWRLLAVLGFGVLVASTLLAVAPVYTRVMNDLGLQTSLRQQLQSSTRNGFTRFDLPLGSESAVAEERAMTAILADEVSWFSESEVRNAALTTLTSEPASRIPIRMNRMVYADGRLKPRLVALSPQIGSA